jgi:drug/metabolite transporter (DMT)-like permease
MRIGTENFAKLMSAYAGLVFGIYWIPLRALDANGLSGPWATVGINAVPLVCVVPFVIARYRKLAGYGANFHIGTLLLGVAITLYSTAYLFTDVITVVVLYYLLPLWGFLLARIFIKEAISPVRWISMALGLFGIFVILGVDNGYPIQENPGDWMALSSGFLWSAGSLFLLIDKHSTAIDCGLGFIVWGALGAVIAAVSTSAMGYVPFPDLSSVPNIIPWLIPVALLVIIPGCFATVVGPRVLNPGVVGILFMTEISVGTISAALLTEEPFGIQQITGVLIISLAGILETVWIYHRNSIVH